MRLSSYSVKQKDEYIDIVWTGHITREMARSCIEEIAAIAKELVNRNKPVLTRFRVVDPPLPPNVDAFEEGLNIFKAEIPLTRSVMWGHIPRLVRILVDILLETYSGDYLIKYIEDEQQALSWLLHGDKTPVDK